jgi:hypothetical protein
LFRAAGDTRRAVTTMVYAVYHALIEGADADAAEIVEQVGEPALAAVDAPGLPYVLLTSGVAALFNDDLDAAARRIGRALEQWRETGAQHLGPDLLLAVAGLAAAFRRDGMSARLAGAALAHPHALSETGVHRRVRERFLAPARHRHGVARWDDASATGAEMTIADAIDYARAAARHLAQSDAG